MGVAYASEVAAVGQVGVLAVSGETDLATAQRFADDLEGAMALTPGDLVLDCSDLEFMDSTALCVLLGARNTMAANGRELLLVATDRHVRRLFEVTGLAATFRFEDSLEAAMRRARDAS